MEFRIILGIILLSITLFTAAMLIPEDIAESAQTLPWQIEKRQGSIRVFNLTLGQSTLSDAEQLFLGDSEISLFRSMQDQYTVEAYFDKVMLGGLSAKIILIVEIPKSKLNEMYSRGTRISKLGSGSNKVSLNTVDLHLTRKSVISSITYIPAINLDAEQIISRFGQPEKRVNEKNNNTEHWLYPDIGLGVIFDPDGKEILQYVAPDMFNLISEPLDVL